MRIATLLAIHLVLVELAQAQWTREELAEEYTERLAYETAETIWSDLAESEYLSWDRKLEFARYAADCAIEVNHTDKALEWSALIIQYGDLNEQDVLRHASLLRINGQHNAVAAILSEAAKEYPGNKTIQDAVQHDIEVLGLLNEKSDYEVTRYRAAAAVPEYSATPYKAGLVYVASGIQTGFLKVVDPWTGVDFNNLFFIEDRSIPEPELSFVERLTGAKVFDEFGKTRTHDGPVSFNLDESVAVLTRNAQSLDSSSNVLVSRLQLEFFEANEGVWTPVKEFNWNSTEYSCGHGTFDAQGALIFASDRPGGFGGSDLYRSEWNEEQSQWSIPENLGPEINSNGNEVFPFVGESGNLYFSSDGWPGLGGLDVFYAFEGESTLHRFGTPINSNQDDFSFHFDDLKGIGWLSSNREVNRDAIYEVEGEPLMNEVIVSVVSCDGAFLPGVSVSIQRVGSDKDKQYITDSNGQIAGFGVIGRDYRIKVIPFAGMSNPPSTVVRIEAAENAVTIDLNDAVFENQLLVVDAENKPLSDVLLTLKGQSGEELKAVTNQEGVFKWESNEQFPNAMSMNASLINFADANVGFAKSPTGCMSSIDQTVQLEQAVEEEQRIDLDLILYDLGSAKLRESSKLELDKLVSYLQRKPDVRVELSSHTDCRGNKESNQRLSQARAESCVNYIVGKGIEKDRIIARGYGENRLLNGCSDEFTCGCVPPQQAACEPCSEFEHQKNRRTELRLLAE